MHENGEAQAPAYRAFISYSHADAKFAGWLHRKLEGYRLPVRGPGEALPPLSPIFLDRAELAAATDLSAAVRQAIASSAALVVVASPSARTSQWVAQEIELFRELHPDRPILAALCDGEPTDSFPPPLLQRDGQAVEPLAADFRKGQDGRRLGLLKIVAGLTGQPLDRLVQRDAQKRQLRVMAVTAMAGVLIVVLTTLLILAIQARAEAERQRAEAEGMVEFMLTDLRDRLKGVGRLDVMDAVNQRAMRHYARQDLSALPDESLNRRARLLHAMGEDDEKQAQYAAARKKYREAHRVTAAVLARNPRDPDAIFAHAQSEYWVGAVEWSTGNLAGAGKPWRGYLEQAEALAKIEPRTARAMMELGYAHGNLCDYVMTVEKPSGALSDHCFKAVEFEKEAIKLEPAGASKELELANRYGWIAVHLESLGRLADALPYRAKEAQLMQELVDGDPRNVEYRYRRFVPEYGKAKLLTQLGRPAEANTVLLQARGQIEGIVASSPGNVTYMDRDIRVAWWLARTAIDMRRSDADQRVREVRKKLSEYSRFLASRDAKEWDGLIAQLEGEARNGT